MSRVTNGIFAAALVALVWGGCGAGTASGPGGMGGAQRELAECMNGVWKDPETGTEYTFVANDSGVQLVSLIDSDGEIFSLSNSGWKGEQFAWDYVVGSTGAELFMVTRSCSGDEMPIDWSGTMGGGIEYFQRVSKNPYGGQKNVGTWTGTPDGQRSYVNQGGNPGYQQQGGSGKAALVACMTGIWMDPETSTAYMFLGEGEELILAAMVDDDGEEYEATVQGWQGNAYHWEYVVGSTGAELKMTVRSCAGDRMPVEWSGTMGGGVENFVRVQLEE